MHLSVNKVIEVQQATKNNNLCYIKNVIELKAYHY